MSVYTEISQKVSNIDYNSNKYGCIDDTINKSFSLGTFYLNFIAWIDLLRKKNVKTTHQKIKTIETGYSYSKKLSIWLSLVWASINELK